MQEKIKAWHQESVRRANAELRAAGVCVMRGAHDEEPAPAAYLWHGKKIWGVGNELPICARCCALWRQNAADDPGLAPELITQFPAISCPHGEPGCTSGSGMCDCAR